MRPFIAVPRRAPRGLPVRVVLSFWILLVVAASADGAQAHPTILRIRHRTADEYTRIVLDLTEAASYEVRRVVSPDRIAINVKGAVFQATTPVGIGDGLIKRIRRNAGADRAQVVLDLQRSADFRDFKLAAEGGRPDRIVIDVLRGEAATGAPETTQVASSPAAPAVAASSKPFTVVLDPGHGGDDPGAIHGGIREKDVVLQVAIEVARLLNGIPGYRAVLTRTSDCALSLGRRVQVARKLEGDLFLSIHANANGRQALSGMEVYFLSLQGATDRQAQLMAARENAADLVGLNESQKRDEAVVAILADLRLTRIQQRSQGLAESVLAAAQRSSRVKARRVKQARFQVLRTLAMPAALVELAYLSNHEDRQLLASPAGRRELSRVIVDGILSHRQDGQAVPVVASETAWTQRYRVRGGDTLWRLAQRYGTTITEICARNDLRTARLLAGQLITLPDMN